MAGMLESGTVPSWQRSPLATFRGEETTKKTTHDDMETTTIMAAKKGAQTETVNTAPETVRVIEFMQQKHAEAMASLLSEVDTLKAENRDLKFRLVMRDTTGPPSVGDGSMEDTFNKTAQSEIRDLQDKLEAEKAKRDDMEFDLQSEIKRLRSALIAAEKKIVMSEDIVRLQQLNKDLQAQVQSQTFEIGTLHEELSAAQNFNARDNNIAFSTRQYVYKSDNLRLGPIDGGTDSARHSGRILPEQLSAISQNRQYIRQRRLIRRASTSQLPDFATEIGLPALPALSVSTKQKAPPNSRASIGRIRKMSN